MREAPSVVLIRSLIEAGARVQAYDPEAMESVKRELPAEWFENGAIQLCRNQYRAVEDVDALVLVTEWKPFRHSDFGAMMTMMKQPVIFDGRNQYDPQKLAVEGFEYAGIGRRGDTPEKEKTQSLKAV